MSHFMTQSLKPLPLKFSVMHEAVTERGPLPALCRISEEG